MKNHFNESVALRTMMIIALLLLMALITGLGISCQSQSLAPPASSPALPQEPTLAEPPATPPQIEVTIEGFAYKPATLNIPVGTTVIWYNKDTAPHTVTARDKSFDSGSLSRDGSFSLTFKQRGTFEYYCTIHPYMEGKVVVD